MSPEKSCDDWLAAWTGKKIELLRSYYYEQAFCHDPAHPEGIHGTDLLLPFKKLLIRTRTTHDQTLAPLFSP